MLVIEQQSNGRRVVVLKKDWHPSRIGKAYVAPPTPRRTHESVPYQTSNLRKGQP